jgi:hypothetical protein
MIAWWRWYFHGQALKIPQQGCVGTSEQRFKEKFGCSANRCQAYGLARCDLFTLSKRKTRPALTGALTSSRPDPQQKPIPKFLINSGAALPAAGVPWVTMISYPTVSSS